MSEGKLLESFIVGEFPAAIWDNGIGFLCGYLGVPPGHPWYGCHDLYDIDVHGGVTLMSASHRGHPAEIVHLEQRISEGAVPNGYWERMLAVEQEHRGEPSNFPIETDLDIWWIGFDCAHLYDAPRPGTKDSLRMGEGTFRDESYVRHEIEGLARQAAEAAQNATVARG